MKTLKDYAHLYLGCDIQYPDTDGTIITAKLTGTTNGDGLETTYFEVQKNTSGSPTVGDYLSWEPNGHHNSNALHVKLILRPLSDMTQEEGRKYVELRGYEAINSVTILAGGIEFTHPGMNTYISFENNKPEQFAFLLSNGFDIFGLIEAGLAVSKTETKN